MKVRIHRGTREIGGTCIEVEAQGKRIALDVGLPLDGRSMSISCSGVATRSASVPERAAPARRAVTSRQRGRSASGEPTG